MSHIVIHWHEYCHDYNVIPEETKFNSFAEAHTAIRNIYHNDPTKVTNCGYDKLKFSIYFTDGESYEDGRLDISVKEDNPFDSDNVIGKHCVDFLTYESEAGNATAKEMLDKYSFDDIPSDEMSDFHIFIAKNCGVDYRLEHDDAFSTMKEKQYFLVVDEELEDDFFTLENSQDALDKLILQYNDIEFPTSPKELLLLLDTAYDYGVRRKTQEMAELLNAMKTVINDWD